MKDVSFTLSCTNWITHFRWFLFKKKEPETIDFLNKHLNAGDVFFDIGANVGVFSIYAAIKEKIKVCSFEPEASNLAILKENIIENELMENVHVFGIGLSDKTGLSNLHIHDFTPGSALHTEEKKDIDYTATGNKKILWKEGIYTTTIDQFCTDMNIFPNVIKIDTDGTELKILNGSKKTLDNKNLKAIIIEISNQVKEECEKILLKAGFEKRLHSNNASENQIWLRP